LVSTDVRPLIARPDSTLTRATRYALRASLVLQGKLKGEETAVVDHVAIIGHGKGGDITHANIKLRFNRNPVIGDKFSSRHGQKGVLSRLYDDVDMPFSVGIDLPDSLTRHSHSRYALRSGWGERGAQRPAHPTENRLP